MSDKAPRPKKRAPRTRAFSRAALQAALGAIPGEVVRQVASAGAPLSRYGGRSAATAAALSSALRALAHPPPGVRETSGQLSLELIARRVGRPPEEVRRWAKAGVLGPHEGSKGKDSWGPGAMERARLADYLLKQGVTWEELRLATEESRLPELVLRHSVTGDPTLDMKQVAARAGLPVEFAASVWQAMGLPLPDPSERMFSSHEVEAMRLVGAMRAVFPDEDLVEATSVVGRAMGEIAEAVVELFRRRLAQPFAEAGVGELEAMLRLAAIVDLLVPSVGMTLELSLRRHLEVVGRSGALMTIEDGGGGELPELAVGFADLSGFTRLTGKMSPLQVSQLAQSLVRHAEVVMPAHGGRVVKSIGDAVMFTTRDTPGACLAALDLEDRVREDAQLPELHTGIAFGPVLRAYADYFGRTANVAARLCDSAGPGTVLVLDPEPAPDWAKFGLVAARPRRMRLDGIPEPVPVVRVSRISGPGRK